MSDPYTYKPKRLRVAPEVEREALERATRAAQVALGVPDAAIAVIVARSAGVGDRVSLQSSIAGDNPPTLARLLEDGPGSLSGFIRRRFFEEKG